MDRSAKLHHHNPQATLHAALAAGKTNGMCIEKTKLPNKKGEIA